MPTLNKKITIAEETKYEKYLVGGPYENNETREYSRKPVKYWVVKINDKAIKEFSSEWNTKTAVDRWVEENLSVPGIRRYYALTRKDIKRQMRELNALLVDTHRQEKEKIVAKDKLLNVK